MNRAANPAIVIVIDDGIMLNQDVTSTAFLS
jgi:hypothetical protein